MNANKVYINDSTALRVNKSNSFISAVYSTDALSAKVLSICLTHIDIVDGTPVATVKAAEFKNLLGKKDTNIYTKLKNVGKKLLKISVFLEDPGQERFVGFNMVNKVEYENSNFSIELSKEMTPHVSQLKSSYTSYELKQILPLQSTYAIRLYELLKSNVWRANRHAPIVVVEYDVSELRFELGCVDMDPQELKDYTKRGLSWEEIESKVDSTYLKRWDNFKRYVLERSRKEFEKCGTDIAFDYEPIRMGVGGAVRRVRFSVWNRKVENEEIPKELLSYIGYNGLTQKDLLTLYEDANESIEAIKNAIKMADAESYIENYVGWLRSCIKGKWTSEKIETLHGSKEKADNIRAIIESVDEQKEDPNSEMFIRMWENMKKREDFEKYLSQISEKERDYMEFLDYQTRVENFIDWRKSQFNL